MTRILRWFHHSCLPALQGCSPGNPLMNVTMQQWMYRMEDGSVTIRTTVSKLGFIVAEITEQFTHLEKG
jgi:hypothetical protein